MDRSEKQAFVQDLHQVINDNEVLVVAHYSGLDVASMSALRNQVKAAGGTLKVAKNRLTKLALQGTNKAGIADLLTGPTVLAYSSDPVAAPKVLSKFAETNDNLVIIGGALGSVVLDEKGVNALAKMPSLDELRGKIIGLIQAPATKLAGVTQAPAAQLARVFNAYATKGAS